MKFKNNKWILIFKKKQVKSINFADNLTTPFSIFSMLIKHPSQCGFYIKIDSDIFSRDLFFHQLAGGNLLQICIDLFCTILIETINFQLL